MKRFAASSIERLENRIAPAAVVVSYTDVDGDLVKIADSSGHLTSSDLIFVGGGASGQLAELNLAASGFTGASITFSVTQKTGGDGLANVGFVDAGTNNLGVVVVKGDLGRIEAGSGSATIPALKSLSVNSMGRLGIDTQSGLTTPTLESDITGNLGSLTIAHDEDGAFLNVSKSIGPIAIGGSLLGGAGKDSGNISANGNIGAVKIGGDVEGGAGAFSGTISANDSFASLTINGSLNGGEIESYQMGAVKIGRDDSGTISNGDGTLASVTIGGSLIQSSSNGGEITSSGALGAVRIGHSMLGSTVQAYNGAVASVTIGGSCVGGYIGGPSIGPVTIGGSLVGGSGRYDGAIESSTSIGAVSIGGSLIGGTANDTGEIYCTGNIGAVKIGGNLTGGSISGTTAGLDGSGLIDSGNGNIAGVTIGGSIISGSDSSTGGALTYDASIRAGGTIGFLTVAGSLLGNPDGAVGPAASPVIISASASISTDVAIGKITIGGRVEDAVILAGYNTVLTPVTNASIGAVKVGGDWIASDLVAGATNYDLPMGAPFPNFGNTSDASISGASGYVAKIASISIAGAVYGTPAAVNATDNFGFVAQQIGSVEIAGSAFKLASGTTPQPVGETGDVDIHVI